MIWSIVEASGWTWEYIEETMTLPRLEGLRRLRDPKRGRQTRSDQAETVKQEMGIKPVKGTRRPWR